MIELFKNNYPGNPAISLPGRQGYIEDRLEEAFTRLAWYYRRSVHTVESDHILVQIIQHISASYTGDDARFYHAVANQAEKICSALRINSVVHRKGLLGKNHFYGKGVDEFLLYRPLGYPVGLDANKHWMDFQPIQALSHPYSDLTMNIRNGTDTKGVAGKAILLIDIPLLLLQYVKWRQATAGQPLAPTIMQFVHQYPLVNLIRSDTAVCYFNQYEIQNVGGVITPQANRYGVSLPNVTNYVQDSQSYVIDRLTMQKTSMVEVAKSIPLPFVGFLMDFLKLPQIPLSRQNLGILTVGYLPYIALMANLSYQGGGKDNGTWAAYLLKYYKVFQNGGYFRDIPGLNQDRIEDFVETAILPYL